MACKYTFKGKTYEAWEFDDLLRAMSLNEAAAWMPTVAKSMGIPYAPPVSQPAAEREVQLSWAAKPGKSAGLMLRIDINGGAAAQLEHLSAMLKVFRKHGPESMLWDANRFSDTVGGNSTEGITGFAAHGSLKVNSGPIDARTKHELNFFLATRGMWLAQDGMSWHAPVFGQGGKGIEFNLGGHLTSAEYEELAAAVRLEFNDYSVAPIPSKDGVRFINATGMNQAEFTEKLYSSLKKTSVFDQLLEANNDTTRSGNGTNQEQSGTGQGVGQGAAAPLRPGSSDLSGGRDDGGNAFSTEGVRTFDLDSGSVTNDWSHGEGQYRDQVVKAWAALKDLPGQNLPKTEPELNTYLADVQSRVDAVNANYADGYSWMTGALTEQERATGVGASFEYPAGVVDSDKAANAYFKHPDGKLQTLYSGTISVIDQVQGGKGEHSRTGAVFYASTSPEYADDRATSSAHAFPRKAKKVGPNVMPVYILASNPFDWRIMAHRDAVLEHMPKATDEQVDALGNGEYATIESKAVLTAAKKAGFDSFFTRDDAEDIGYLGIGLFNPDDVVFAIGVNGQKLAQPDIQFSARDTGVNEGALNNKLNKDSERLAMRKRVAPKDAARKQARAEAVQLSQRDFVGRTMRSYTPEQLAAFANVGFAVKPVSLKDRIKALWKDAGKRLAQGLVDQFAPIKELSTEAYGLLRLAKGAAGSFETLLKGGMLKLTEGVYDFDETRKGGVIDRLLIPMQGEHHDFLRWVAANRAEGLMGVDKEHLFTQDDIDAIKTLADGTLVFDYTLQHGRTAGQVTRSRAAMYADSLVTFNEFNDNVLDMAEQSGLIDSDARALWTSEFYVPFYRATEAGGVAGASMKGGAVRKQAFKSLKGGSDMLSADLLDNTLMNWASLLDASAKNRAAKASLEAAEAAGVAIGTDEETARQMGKATGNSNGTVWFMDGGVKHYFLVDDPFVLTAITSLEYAGMRNPMMNALSAAKNALTVGVTASPFFKVRNLIRDSIQVIGVGNISYNPLKNLKDGWALTKPENDIYFRLLAGGGTIHFGTMLEGSEAKRVQALVESGVDAATILGDEHKVKAFYRKFIEPGITAYNELGNRGEAINRAALYDQLVKQGVSHADASLQARDLMDFSMQGSFATIRFLTQVLPFANSRLQGMYKLGRSAKENPKRMAYVTGAVALASLALLAAYGDDDDWKKRESWDRDNYWWFKFGGTAFRIPKPFELGAIGTLAERSAELLFDNEMTGKRFRGHVLSLLGDNLAMNPVPQLVKPMLDVYANKDSFSGRPIETLGMERLKSDYRFTGSTSMTARAASTTLNAVTGLVGKESLSPVQVDSLIRGYFGWLGMFAVGIADMGARQAVDQPTRPSTDLWKLATGGIVSKLEGAPSRYVSQVYDQAKVLEEAYGTWNALKKQGKVEEAREFKAANDDQIRGYRNVEAIKGAIAKINQRIRAVESGSMDRDAKRAEVNRLNARKDQFARRLAA